MKPLADIQHDFQGYVMGLGPDAEQHVVGDARASAASRLQVYHDAYRLRLIEVLAQDFSGLRALAGDDMFRDIGHDYLAAYPSSNPSVRWFGHALSAFLASHESYRLRPELAEMACFEWAWGRAFDAADVVPLALSAMETIPPENWGRLRVGLHPSLQRVTLCTSVPAIFLATTRDEKPPALESGSPVDWALWRRDLRVYWRSLAPDEAFALEAFARGESFGDVCAGLSRWLDEARIPLRAAGLLRQCLEDGLVASLHTSSP